MFLFTELLVLTRPVTRNERHCYQVYRQPIPVQDLVLEDLQDGDVRMGGSFRGAFSNADKGEAEVTIIVSSSSSRNIFSVSHINLLIWCFLHSQEHFPCEISRPQSGAVPHAAGQRCFPQAAVAQLPPQRHLRPQAPQRALHTLPVCKRRSLQAPPFFRLCHRPHGGSRRKLSAANLSVRPHLAVQQHNPKPHHVPVALLVLFVDGIFIADSFLAHITQNQKGQEISVFFREEKRDDGVNCGERRKWTPERTCFLFIRRHHGDTWDLFMCVRAYHYNSVLCYCPLRQLFTSPLHPSCIPQSHSILERGASSWKGSRMRDTHFTHESVCVTSLLISWRSRWCIQSCLLLIWYLSIILDLIGRVNERFTFLYSKNYCSIFLDIIKQHCFSF